MPQIPDPVGQWWRRFDLATADLTQAEYGAYRLLCNYYYQYAELPATREGIYIVARAANVVERAVCDMVLHKRFKRDGMRWTQPEVDAVIARRNASRTRIDLRAAAAQADIDLDATLPPKVRARDAPKRGRGRPPKRSIILPDTAASAIALPAWVPAELFRAWVEMRRTQGLSNNAKAMAVALKRLEMLRYHGSDPAEVIEHAIVNALAEFRPQVVRESLK